MTTIRSTITRAAAVMLLTTGVTVLGAAPANAAPGTWAAIAISVETGNVGWAYEQPTGAAAASAAVDGCDASDCQEAVRVTNGCAAVAQASNLAWGWAYAASRAEAEGVAKRSAGKGARVIAYACSGAHR